MLRLSSSAARRIGWQARNLQVVRHASSGGGGGGGAGKAVASTVLLTAGVGGGVIGYASVDTDFRKTVQQTVPGSEDVFSAILGPIAPPPPLKAAPSKLRIPGPVVVTKPKEEPKKVEEKPTAPAKPVETKPDVSLASPPPPVLEVPEPSKEVPPPPPIEKPVPAPEPVVAVVKEAKVKEEAPEIKKDPEPEPAPELTPDVENSSLEQVLAELGKEMKNATATAVESYDMSADAVVTHINIMQKVLESNIGSRDENAWNQVFEAAAAKSDALKFAELNEKEAVAAINNVVESIEAGRRNKSTATNPQLIIAEEAVNRALYQLEQAKARISAVEGEARVVEQYRDLVEEGRKQFHQEMASIMPDVKIGEKNTKLTEDELNMFITHAYRKVLHLQQELAKQQTLEQQRFKQALEKQRIEAQMAASDKIDAELERQKRELEVDHQRRLAAIREDAETELRTQLRRQAAAHSDHLSDVLTVQETELRRKHEHDLNEKLSSAESEFLSRLSGLSGSLQGLEKSLEDRAAGDAASVHAQKLWLACVALNDSVQQGNTEAANLDESMKPLKSEISTIKSMAGENEFVGAIVSGIPATAVERGVYTEQGLRDRFNRVETVARRVGSIGSEGGSLIRYGLSYLQSLLLVDTMQRTPTPTEEPIDVSELSTSDILNLARFSLERGDTIRAVQYMNLLDGEPKRVASDWISEARLHLEARQASQALLAHAAAVGLEVLPK